MVSTVKKSIARVPDAWARRNCAHVGPPWRRGAGPSRWRRRVRFLGRNGAGKTTLIRILLGLIAPTGGEVEILGTQVRAGRTAAAPWARVGYLVEGPGLYSRLTVAEHLRIAADLRNLGPDAVATVAERLDLTRYAGVRAGVLSLGNRQRLGLDPAGVVEVRDLLRELADDGTTVFMSTHLITEVARLADRIGIIHEGRLVRELSGDRLGGNERPVMTFRGPEPARRATAALHACGIAA